MPFTAPQSKMASRWLFQSHGGAQAVATTQTFTVGRVFLTHFEVREPSWIDRAVYVAGSNPAGSVVVGVYGPITSEETCDGAPLIAQTDPALNAQTVTNNPEVIDFTTSILLRPGRYYMAFQGASQAGSYMRHANQTQVTGWTQYYDRAGGFGALTDPCPATTVSASVMPGMRLRVSNV